MPKRYVAPVLPDLPELPRSPKMGNTLTAEISNAYLANSKTGYVEEDYNVTFIKRFLLTVRQQNILHVEILSIEDLLNGRFPISDWGMIDTEFFKVWNEALGEHHFGV